MKLSYSRISSYLRCPHLFRLRYVEREPPAFTAIALPFGSAFHDAVAYAVQNPGADSEDLHRHLQEFLVSRVDSCEAPVRFNGKALPEIQDQGRAMLDAYLQDPIGEVNSTEQHFLVNLGDAELEGYIDYMRGGEIIELKTSARSYSQLQVDLSLQASCYAAPLIFNHGLADVQIRFHVVTKTKKPKVQQLTTWRSEGDMEILRQTVEEVCSGINHGVFPRNIGPQTCSGCEYQGMCLKTAVPV